MTSTTPTPIPPEDEGWPEPSRLESVRQYLSASYPARKREFMRVPVSVRMSRGRDVLLVGGELPGRPVATKPEYPEWEDMAEGHAISIPFSKVTWLMPRRTLICLAFLAMMVPTLYWQGSVSAGIALFGIVLAGTGFWTLAHNRLAIWMDVLAVALTIGVGWSFVHVLAVGFELLLAAIAWDIVNGIRFTDELTLTNRRVQPHKGLIRPNRLPGVGGESIDEVSGRRSVLANWFGWDVGHVEITTASGKKIRRNHVPSWRRVLDIVDGIDIAGGMSKEQVHTMYLMKAQFNRGELDFDDIVAAFNEKTALLWVEQRERRSRNQR
jgi:hypothetical protein